MTPREDTAIDKTAQRLREIAADLRGPFAAGDYVPGNIEDALGALDVLARDLELSDEPEPEGEAA